MNFQDIIIRLEAATGPDRQLDNAIEGAIDLPKPTNPDELPGWPPYYTASIDDALTLVPKGLRWYAADSDDRSDDRPVAAAFPTVAVFSAIGIPRSVGATPAIALCIAALKARAV